MRKTGIGLIAALGLSVLPAAAGPVTYYPVRYTCDATISAATCNSLNNTLGLEYSQLFTNAAANIYITMGALPNGTVGHNDQFYTTVNYADYYKALQASIAGPADAAAVASLPSPVTRFSNPINSGYQISLTSALDTALGFTGAEGPRGTCKPGDACSLTGCQLGPSTISTCFNGVVTLSNSKLFDYGDSDAGSTKDHYDFFTVVQHETDEILGTGSCIKSGQLLISSFCLNGLWGTSASDLFRYVGPGQRGFSIGPQQIVTIAPAPAYFSIDGGATAIAGLSNSAHGDDYGDIPTVCEHVQDSIGCTNWTAGTGRRGMDLTTDGGAEIAMLDAIGYQLTHKGGDLSAASLDYAPEPSSIGLVSIGLGLSGVVWRRRRQRS